MTGGPRLPEDAVARELATAPDWARDGEAIRRTWRFADFKTAMTFVEPRRRRAERA